MAVKKVAILGGGTSGWLTAIFFKKVWPALEITVIEDPKHPPIIAGESCTAPFVDLLDFLNIDVNDWIKKVDAFPKLGGKFEGWGPNNSDFVQPLFSSYKNRWDYKNPEFGKDNVLLKGLLATGLPLHKITLSGHLLENNITPFTPTGFVTRPMYHFDSRKNAEYFKNIGKSLNINLILSKYQSCKISDNGIESLTLEDQEVYADFYIDCSGFNQLLLKKALGVEFKNFSKYFPATSVIAWWDESDLKPYSRMIAMDYGWRFNLDLQSRSGNGYVYDGSLISSEQAQQEVERKLNKSVNLVAKASWQAEMAIEPWQKNVIAIGLSSGFLEPLGSGGHTMIALTLQLLSEFWNPEKETHGHATTLLNSRYKDIVDDTVDFISLHYRNNRSDTEFWRKHLSEEAVPQSLKLKIEQLKSGNFYDIGVAYSLENYAVVLQAYELIDKSLLANIIRYKNEKNLDQCIEEYNLLNNQAKLIIKDCIPTTEWKKLYD